MNIAILISELGGGGAERVAKKLGDYYSERGENIFYFLGDSNTKNVYNVSGKIIQTGIKPISSERKLGKINFFYKVLKAAYCIRSLKKKYHINLSISFLPDFNCYNALSRCGDRVILRSCTILTERHEAKTQLLYDKNIVHWCYSLADKLVVMSRDGYSEMKNWYGVRENKIIIIPNFISHNSVPLYAPLHEDIGQNYIISIGRLDPVKQQDRLIRAFRLVAEQDQKTNLVILGQGPLSTYLKGLCRRYGLEKRVFFIGFTWQTKVYLERASVFVMTSLCAGFPNSMLEEIELSIPVIATDSPGGIRDILGSYGETTLHLDGYKLCEYGILTPRMPRRKLLPSIPLVEEETVLGKAILSILKDESLYLKMRKASRCRAESYRKDKIIDKWNGLVYL